MPQFTIQVPDGRTLTVQADNQDQALKGVQDWYAQNPKQDNPAIKAAAPIAGAAAPNPQASALPGVLGQLANTSNAAQSGFNQGMTLGFGDELFSGAMAPIKAGINALQGQGFDLGKAYNDELALVRQTNRDRTALNPVASGAGEITGALVGPGKGGSLLKDAATGALYGFGSSDGDLKDRAAGAATGGVIGGALGKLVPGVFKAGGNAVESVLQNRATDAAVKNAPAAADLASAASQLFTNSKAAGVGVKPQVFGTFAANLARQAHAADIDKELDPGAWAVYERLIQKAQDGFSDPSSLSLAKLHNLRQMAQDVVIEAKKPRTKGFAQNIVDGLDNMISGLKPGDMTFPGNRIGGPGATQAGSALLEGISTWSRAKKVGMIESAIAKAQNYPSGLESGLRMQFKSILNSNKTSKLFTPTEQAAMRRVINGTLPVAGLRALGIFRGLGGAALGSMLGGPLGTLVGGAAGLAGRKITEMSTEAAAQRAGRIVATPNIPKVTLNNPLARLPGAPLALPLIDQTRKPLELTIRGGRG